MTVVYKEQLIDEVAVETGILKKTVKEVLDSLIEVTEKAVAEGNKVSLVGHFSLERKEVKGRTGKVNGVNWKTDDHYAVKFKSGKKFEEKVNL